MSHSARGRADLPALRKELPNLNLGPQAGSGPGRQGHGLQTVGDGITVAEEALGVCGRGPWRRSGALQVALGGQVIQAERRAGGQRGGLMGGAAAGGWARAGGWHLCPPPPQAEAVAALCAAAPDRGAVAACSPLDAVRVMWDTVSLRF